MPDRRDWEEFQKRAQPVSAAEQRARERHRERSRIVADRMGSLEAADDWTTYTIHLDALVATDEAERDELLAQLGSPDMWGDAVDGIRLRLQRVEGRLDARRQDRALPATLREQAEKTLTTSATSV